MPREFWYPAWAMPVHRSIPRLAKRARAWCGALLVLPFLSLTLTGPEAHAQEEAAPTGIVRITSPIPKARVYVDNEDIGEAPVVRYLPAGTHVIRVSADGFDPFVRRVEIAPGTTLEVAAQLIAGAGTVEFLVQPSGAKLVINGADPVPTPVRLRDLAPGDYRYKVTAPGHEPEEGTFTFAKGRNLLFNVRLKSTAGLLEVKSTPAPARIWLDDQSVGESPLALEGVAPGEHVVRLELAEYATVFRRFDNSDNSKGDIVVSMPTDGASLAIDTGQPAGEVRLEGHLMGQGVSVRIPELERGRYHVSVSAPGYQTVEETIDLPPKGRLLLAADLAPEGERRASTLSRERPLLARWTFWGGVTLGAGAATAGGVLLANALAPEPVPTSDTVVVLP